MVFEVAISSDQHDTAGAGYTEQGFRCCSQQCPCRGRVALVCVRSPTRSPANKREERKSEAMRHRTWEIGPILNH